MLIDTIENIQRLRANNYIYLCTSLYLIAILLGLKFNKTNLIWIKIMIRINSRGSPDKNTATISMRICKVHEKAFNKL